MTFRVGMKVVCVDDAYFLDCGETFPKRGEVYTVRAIIIDDDGSGLHLMEIVNLPQLYSSGKVECDFRTDRFRPLIDTSQSVSFTVGAPKDSEVWDGRRKINERA